MQATNVLMSEHRVIEQVLNCLEQLSVETMRTGRLDRTPAQQILEFFRQFADRCHHGKEEDLLFPLLETRGLSREGGPTGVMLAEHEAGRASLRGMATHLLQAAEGNATACQHFVAHARDYLDLLRQHIWKEENRLFVMASRVLSDTDQTQLLTQFHAIEQDEMGKGTHEYYLGLANALADRFQVPHVQQSATPCCHH